MTVEQNKAIVRQMLAALDQHDHEALKVHPGLHETLERQPLVRAAFPDLHTTVEHQIGEGNMVATYAVLHGTNTGPFLGRPATGQHVEYSVLILDRVTEGKIVLHYANADWITLLIRLGVIAPPPMTGAE